MSDAGLRDQDTGPRRAEPAADERCDVCGAATLVWRNCKLICASCRSIVKSCADL